MLPQFNNLFLTLFFKHLQVSCMINSDETSCNKLQLVFSSLKFLIQLTELFIINLSTYCAKTIVLLIKVRNKHFNSHSLKLDIIEKPLFFNLSNLCHFNK